jgi:t-SNARE complex subunit (syntaxin)
MKKQQEIINIILDSELADEEKNALVEVVNKTTTPEQLNRLIDELTILFEKHAKMATQIANIYEKYDKVMSDLENEITQISTPTSGK